MYVQKVYIKALLNKNFKGRRNKLKYKNANSILPAELIETIQQYVQGEYIYIPIRDKLENIVPTEYEVELQKRDGHIYTKYLEGVSNKRLSDIYSLSESSIRRIIINQRKKYEEMKTAIKNILDNWNIKNNENLEIKQIYDTAWQIGGEYVLKVYENIELLERNIKISMVLDDMGIPVGKIIFTRDNTAFSNDEKYYYVLSNKLNGRNIVTINDILTIAGEMGKIIAELHCAFKKCDDLEEFWNNSLLFEINGWIKDILQNSGWRLIDENKFNMTAEKLEALYDKLPVQLIHRDVHFGNFLFHNGKFSGYIDFDLSQRNVRIFDLCYFMLGLLSEEEKIDLTEEEWFKILKDIFNGYESIISLNEAEKEAVPYVMKAIELLFAAWFISQKDMKCAENAVKIFEFVDKNSDRISNIVG